MNYDVVIRGGHLLIPERGRLEAELAIKDGRVAAILPRDSKASAEEEIDAVGKWVIPGIVDPHTHLELGPAEERYLETRSAAIGGVTTVMTYIMNATPFSELFVDEVARLERESVTDVVIHVGLVTPEHIEEIPFYVEKLGLTSFKHFMNFKRTEGAYMGVGETDDGHLYLLMRALSRYPQAVLGVHPENIEIVWRLAAELKETGRDDLAAYTESRPDFVEANSIATVLLLARVTGARVYIPHVTSEIALDTYRRMRPEEPGRSYAETCPHYLTHTMYNSLGNVGKVNPPLRTQRDIEALWQGIADGTIVSIGSDHVPRKLEKKQGTVWASSAGFPGLSTLLPVMLSEGYHRRQVPLETIIRLCSYNPARIYGLYPRKGTLLPGADADVVLVDLDRERTVSAAEAGSFADYSLYEGWRLRGWPVRTLVRGRTVMRDGEIVAPAGHGRFIPRGEAAAQGAGEAAGAISRLGARP